MFDAAVRAALAQIPQQMVQAWPVVVGFARANPLTTVLIVAGLLIGGGEGVRRPAYGRR
jgi:hypothetical protein